MGKWRQNCFFLGVGGELSLPRTEFICMFMDNNEFALLSVTYNFQSKIAPMESESDNPGRYTSDKE